MTGSIGDLRVDAIEPVYGEVVRLRLEGLDPPEIAERIGIPCNTVRIMSPMETTPHILDATFVRST
ncbi:sigma factor-like helix-turn-helix DNA-binding protein [Nannocystaceae bacterium ST9]